MSVAALETIGARLKSWREEANLNQAEAAAKAKVSQATWSDWEGDKKLPSADKALDLEDATDGAVTARDCAEAARARRAEHAKGDGKDAA